MKKLYLLLSLLFIYSSEGKAQLVNGDFENWVTDTQTGGLIPDGWGNFHAVVNTLSVTQAAGRTSTYSAKVTGQMDAGDYIGGGLLAEIVTNEFPTSISGYWKVINPDAIDELAVRIVAYDVLDNYIDTYDFGSGFGTAVNNWTFFTRTPWIVNGVDHILVEFFMPDNPVSNTMYFQIDDITLGFPAKVDEMQNMITNLIVKPTVSNGNFSVDLSCTGSYKFKFNIVDMMGKVVAPTKEMHLSLGSRSIDFNYNLPNGVYSLIVSSDRGQMTKKIVIQN